MKPISDLHGAITTKDQRKEALARERQLKHWTHGKKQALIDGNMERLKQLSGRRS